MINKLGLIVDIRTRAKTTIATEPCVPRSTDDLPLMDYSHRELAQTRIPFFPIDTKDTPLISLESPAAIAVPT
jgi:hypothetical protein